MIITCPSCNKKFEIDAILIPDNGRTLECGSCGEKWFYKKQFEDKQILFDISDQDKKDVPQITKTIIKEAEKNISKKPKKNKSALIKYEKKSRFTFGKFLSYIVVIIISFVSLMIILDTFKTPLYSSFPNLEFIVFSFYETLKDISLFIKDLT